MQKNQKRTKNDITASFNKNLNELLRLLICLAKTETDKVAFDRVKQRIQLAKQFGSLSTPLDLAGKYLVLYNEYIVRKDVDFVFKIDPLAECAKLGVSIDSENSFLLDLFNNMRNSCADVPLEEKNILADHVFNMYRDYLEYRTIL